MTQIKKILRDRRFCHRTFLFILIHQNIENLMFMTRLIITRICGALTPINDLGINLQVNGKIKVKTEFKTGSNLSERKKIGM